MEPGFRPPDAPHGADHLVMEQGVEALSDVPADAVAALDRPDPIPVLPAQREHHLVAVAVGGDRRDACHERATPNRGWAADERATPPVTSTKPGRAAVVPPVDK